MSRKHPILYTATKKLFELNIYFSRLRKDLGAKDPRDVTCIFSHFSGAYSKEYELFSHLLMAVFSGHLISFMSKSRPKSGSILKTIFW